MKKSNRNLLGIIVGLGFLFVILIEVLPTAGITSSIVQDGVNIADYFAPFATLDLTSGQSAPAISCSLTNNVHMIGTDGSSFTVNSATPLFQPTYQSLINPYNGKFASSQDDKVFLYCSPSTLSKYGYYPYLTGGTITIQFNAKDSTGYYRPISSVTVPVSPVDSSGKALPLPLNMNDKSIQIAYASIPVSSIILKVVPTTTDFYSLQQVITTGSLTFKQTPTLTISATHVISPLYTTFSYLVQATQQIVPLCKAGMVQIGNGCFSVTQSITTSPTSYDKSKGDTVPYTITVNGWTSSQKYPVVTISTVKTTTSSYNTFKTINFNSAPNTLSNNVATWKGVLSIKNDLGGNAGTYSLTLLPNSVLSVARSVASQDFVVFDSTVSGSVSTNPAPTPSTSGSGIIQFLYSVNYESGYTDNGVVPKNGIPITFAPQNLISSSTSGKMLAFRLSTQMTVNDQNFANLNIVSSKLTHTGTITVSGYGTIPLTDSELSASSAKVNGRQSSGQAAIYTFDTISVDPQLIDGKISFLAPPQILSSIPVNIEIDTTGTFILADSTGKQYTGVISGGVFTYGTNFGTVVNTNTGCTSQQIGIGFSTINGVCTPPSDGTPACTASQSAAGYTTINNVCVPPAGSTTNVCTDSSGNTITCPPIANPTPYCQLNPTTPACNTTGKGVGGSSNGTSAGGVAGFCPAGTSIQDCLTSVATSVSQINGSTPTSIVNNNLLVLIIIGIAIIGAIVYTLRKRK